MQQRDVSPFTIPLVLLTLVVTGYVLHLGKMILLPLIIALLLCQLCQPLITRLRRYRIPWPVTVSGLMLILLVALIWVGGAIASNASAFLRSIDQQEMAAALNEAQSGQEVPPEITWEMFQAAVDESFQTDEGGFDWDKLLAALKSTVSKLAGLLLGAVMAVLSLINQVFLVLFFMLFIFAEQNVSRNKILLAAGGNREETEAVMKAIERDVHSYLMVKTGISAATGVICFLGLWLMGVEYAAVFALLTFLLNFIPTFGSILAALFPVVAAWVQTGEATIPAAVFGMYLVVNMVFGNIIEPRVLGKQLNLSPLVILVAVLFWSALWGVAGMFLAVPLTRTVQLVFANIPSMKAIAILMSNGEDESAAPA